MLPSPMMEPATERRNSTLLLHWPLSSILSSALGTGSLVCLAPLVKPLAASPSEQEKRGSRVAQTVISVSFLQWNEGNANASASTVNVISKGLQKHKRSRILFNMDFQYQFTLPKKKKNEKTKHWHSSLTCHCGVTVVLILIQSRERLSQRPGFSI